MKIVMCSCQSSLLPISLIIALERDMGKKNYPISWRSIVPRGSSWSSNARW
jgi:hypothetical protein